MLESYFYKLLRAFDKDYIIPDKIRLECSSHCQLRCPSCPTTSGNIHPVVGSGFLRFKDFKYLVDNNRFLKHIELSNYGEIFLNPEFMDILKYSHDHGITLTADNGVNLNSVRDEILEALVKYKFRSMVCSIDGASPESYAKYRIRGDFDKVIGNIKRINRYKEFHNSRYPVLTWQFIVFGHNENEIEDGRKMAEKLNMQFVTKLSWDPEFSQIKDKELVKNQMNIEVSSREEYLNKYNKEYKEGICEQLWNRPQINWDGKILGCCRNFWGNFGENAFESGLLKAINNPAIRHARKMLRGNAEPRKYIPCTTCSIYLNRKKYGNWIDQ